MTTRDINVFVNSRNPKQKGREYRQLWYGEEIGGLITPEVKIIGDNVYIPFTSWVSGKAKFTNVKIPFGVSIISLSIHKDHDISCIGDFEFVKDFRIWRGVYVSGLIRKDDHNYLNAKVVIGYDLSFYSRSFLTLTNYKSTQKKKSYE